MFGTFTLALAVTVADPRPELVELQLAGRNRQALARVEQEIAERPEASRQIGLSYLRGHLLDRLGRVEEASQAFARSMGETPVLGSYGRFRLALDQDRMGHPEVSAGLIATVVAREPGSPLMPRAVRLLRHTLAEGGDCRLLRGLRPETFAPAQRRELLLAQGDCALRTGYPEMARAFLASILEEKRDDDLAHGAADRLSGLVSEAERGRLPMLVGLTFHQHREFERALRHLQRAIGAGDALTGRDAYETQLAIGLSLVWQQRYAEAVGVLSRLAALARTPGERARAVYEEAAAHELRGNWPVAAQRFRQAYMAEPVGRWAAPALLSALRLEWRSGRELAALELYERLATRPEWRVQRVRASLFLAASDLVRARRDRALPWLERAALAGDPAERLEAAYWLGRLAELDGNGAAAVARYLEVARADPYHPLAQGAFGRLRSAPLARVAAATGRRLASSRRPDDLYGAWLLLGNDDPNGLAARRRLELQILADPAAAPYLRLTQVPVRSWPLWRQDLDRPEEMLLALGAWYEGSQAVRQHFPLSEPSLAYTGAQLLARGEELSRSMALAEELRGRTPARVPLALQPAEYRRLLYPFPFRQTILAQEKIRGVPSGLLTAVFREESRFDTGELSPASGSGLAQLTIPTARRLASSLNLQRLSPKDLHRPEVSIALGAAHLGALLKDLGGSQIAAAAAYSGGEPRAIVWRSYCFTTEPEEYFTKIGSRETRDYVRRVLAGQRHYEELY